MKKTILAPLFILFFSGCHELPEVDTLVTCLKYCDTILSTECRPDSSPDPFSDRCKEEKQEQLTCEDQCR